MNRPVVAEAFAGTGEVADDVDDEFRPRLREQRHRAIGAERDDHRVGHRVAGAVEVDVRRGAQRRGPPGRDRLDVAGRRCLVTGQGHDDRAGIGRDRSGHRHRNRPLGGNRALHAARPSPLRVSRTRTGSIVTSRPRRALRHCGEVAEHVDHEVGRRLREHREVPAGVDTDDHQVGDRLTGVIDVEARRLPGVPFPVGNSWMNPGAAGWSAATLRTTAVTPVAGTPPTPVAVNVVVDRGCVGPGAPPSPVRVSTIRAGVSGVSFEPAIPRGSTRPDDDREVTSRGESGAVGDAGREGEGALGGRVTCDGPIGRQGQSRRQRPARDGPRTTGGLVDSFASRVAEYDDPTLPLGRLALVVMHGGCVTPSSSGDQPRTVLQTNTVVGDRRGTNPGQVRLRGRRVRSTTLFSTLTLELVQDEDAVVDLRRR